MKGGLGHAITLYEAHEMCINRYLKMAVVRPTQPYLLKTNYFFGYRIKAQKLLKSQLFPATQTSTPKQNLLDTTSTVKHWDENIMTMSLITKNKLFPIKCNRGVVNVFTGIAATVEQVHDLLNARKVGELHHINYITHHIYNSLALVVHQ